MDPLHVAIALVPLGLYLSLLGAINLRRGPTVMSGGADVGWLAFGCAGLVIVGPMELFMPEAAAVRMGAWVWTLLGGLYAMGITFYILTARPRCVIYNVQDAQLRALLTETASGLDGGACWAGDCYHLPQLGVHFQLEPFPLMRNIALGAVGPVQNPLGWKAFVATLRRRVSAIATGANPRGFSLISAGLMTLGFAIWEVVRGHEQLADNLRDMLRL